MVEAEGMVTANREVAVDTVSGLKVNQIYVNLGDSVSANTLLFDVDQEDLKGKNIGTGACDQKAGDEQ